MAMHMIMINPTPAEYLHKDIDNMMKVFLELIRAIDCKKPIDITIGGIIYHIIPDTWNKTLHNCIRFSFPIGWMLILFLQDRIDSKYTLFFTLGLPFLVLCISALIAYVKIVFSAKKAGD